MFTKIVNKLFGPKCAKCRKAALKPFKSPFTGEMLLQGHRCPDCGSFYCDDCYPNLPWTSYPMGYSKCPDCDLQLERFLE